MTKDELLESFKYVFQGGRGIDIANKMELEAERIAEKFADKDAEKRWLLVCGGMFLGLIGVLVFW